MNESEKEQFSSYTIAQLARALRDREITSAQLTRYAIAQHEKFGLGLNAYREWGPKRALTLAQKADYKFNQGSDDGCLQGIPISVKDIFGMPGYATYAGSQMRLPNQWQRPGPIVQDLKNQLAVMMGKTHTVQFAYGGLGVNHHWGTPRNPWDREQHRVPGGSSSGAGVSLCEGSAFVALGTDTSGSVRVPASYTGVVGLKTSKNRWSTRGIVPLSPILDTPGVLTRTVEDSICAFHALDNPASSIDSALEFTQVVATKAQDNFRIGIDPDRMWNTCEHSIQNVCKSALHALEADGCSTVDLDLPQAEQAIELRNMGSTVSAELTEFLQSELPEWIESLDPVIKERVETGDDISAVEFLKRMRRIQSLRRAALKQFQECDIIASPTVPLSPPTVEELEIPGRYMPKNLLALQNTTVGSFLNMCSLTVPVGLDHNQMPVGFQLMAPAGEEERLLAAGLRLESLASTPKLAL